jgi:hypothetical protein
MYSQCIPRLGPKLSDGEVKSHAILSRRMIIVVGSNVHVLTDRDLDAILAIRRKGWTAGYMDANNRTKMSLITILHCILSSGRAAGSCYGDRSLPQGYTRAALT